MRGPAAGAGSLRGRERAQGKAVIDVGSNSIKLFAAAKTREGGVKTLADRVRIGGLGRGLRPGGALSREAMEENCRIICSLVREAAELGCRDVAAVGTMALREARNSREFLALVKESCGLTIRVLMGLEEARWAYRGVCGGFPRAGNRVVFDIGGGSIEFIAGRGEEAGGGVLSLPLGILAVTEEFLASDPVRPGEERAAGEAVRARLVSGGVPLKGEELIGIGGTVTSMAAVKQGLAVYDPQRVHGLTLSLEEVEGQVALFRSKTLAERRRIAGLSPDRAPVILAGAIILREVLRLHPAPLLLVSDRGLRHGVMEELLRASGPGTIFQETAGELHHRD